MSNKPVPFQTPGSIVRSILELLPQGASVTVSLPVSESRNVNLSVGISENLSPPRPQTQPNFGHEAELNRSRNQTIDMKQADETPAPYFYQQPEAE